jgi:hypothetical protein
MVKPSHRRGSTVRILLKCVGTTVLMSGAFPALASLPCDRSAAMPVDAVEALMRDPASILRRHADADAGLAEEAHATMVSGLPGRFVLLDAARQGSYSQQEQIGRGIGRAYRTCLRTNRSAAAEILDGMLRSDVSRVSAAFQAEVEVLWMKNSKVQLPEDPPMDEIGTSPSDVFSGSVPESGITAAIRPYALPPLAGPLPNPFAPIK